jgi:hypothetical protein
MKYEDTMKVMRKMKHHCPHVHLVEETEESLHLYHLTG